VRVPSGIDAIAILGLGPPVTDNRTVTVDSPRTVGTLYFNNGNSYTLGGTDALTLDVSSGSARIDSHNGSHIISAPLVLNDDVAIAVAPAASIFTVSGPITSAGRTIAKAGPGRLDLSAINAAGLTVNAGTAMLLSGGGTSRVQDLTIAGGTTPTARLDMTDNAMVVDYTGGSPLSTIQAQIAFAYSSGSWNGNGIGSSLANATEFGVGYAEASGLSSVPPIFGSVDSTAVLMRRTRYGDANLDGQVTLQDFNALASNFGTSGKGWHQGDFNYDFTVNLQDFNRLAANFGLSAGPDGVVDPQDWAALASAIPEPGTGAGVLVLGAAPLIGGRRRRR
jgi:hypothetical protein